MHIYMYKTFSDSSYINKVQLEYIYMKSHSDARRELKM